MGWWKPVLSYRKGIIILHMVKYKHLIWWFIMVIELSETIGVLFMIVQDENWWGCWKRSNPFLARLSLEFHIFFRSFTNSQPNIDFFGHSQTLTILVDIPASQKGFNVLNNLKFISVAPICFLHSPFTNDQNDHCYWYIYIYIYIYIWLSLLFIGNTAIVEKKKGCSLFHSINFAYCL